MKKVIIAVMLCSVFRIAAAQELVSNVRIEQQGNMVHITYDLAEPADIEVFVSLDNGQTWINRNRRLLYIRGAVGRGVTAGQDRLMIWHAVREVGYRDFSNIVIRIEANAVITISTEVSTGADISIERPIRPPRYHYNDGFYAGIAGGINTRYLDFTFGLNAAYFFNRYIGAGIAVRSFSSNEFDNGSYRSGILNSRHIFFGPTLYYRSLVQAPSGKFFFHFRAGIGGVYNYTIYDTSKSFIMYHDDKATYLGFFVSGGLAIRPINMISIGLNVEYSDMFTQFKYNIEPSFTLDLNFHF